MLRMVVVEPSLLPQRVPAIALHRRDDVLLIVRRGLTEDQVAHWINRLGTKISREAVDATVARSTPAPQPPVRLLEVPLYISES